MQKKLVSLHSGCTHNISVRMCKEQISRYARKTYFNLKRNLLQLRNAFVVAKEPSRFYFCVAGTYCVGKSTGLNIKPTLFQTVALK